MNNLDLEIGPIIYEHTFNTPKFPICDNCGNEITMFGKYIKREGKFLYVHDSYNENTMECS